MKELLKKYPVVLIGSVLVKDNPRDIDIVCILPDKEFKLEFGLSAKQWRKEGKEGNWSNERWEWARKSIEGGKSLAKRLKGNIDFKFIPVSFYEEIKETRLKNLNT